MLIICCLHTMKLFLPGYFSYVQYYAGGWGGGGTPLGTSAICILDITSTGFTIKSVYGGMYGTYIAYKD